LADKSEQEGDPAMPQRGSDHLHRLIRSLSPAEKRYFKLRTAQHMIGGHSNMQVLFDAIVGMEHYDEEALLQRFRNEPFTKRFPVTKRRLYEAVLRSLEGFHADASVDARLHRTLNQVEILYKRALYDDAGKLLQGVRRAARQHDRQAVLLAVQRWERKLMEVANYAGKGAADLDDLMQESTELLAEQEQLDRLWDLKSRVLIDLYRRGQARDEKTRNELAEWSAHPLLQGTARPRTARARFLFHHIHGALHFAMGGLPTCREHLEAAVAVLEENKERFADEPNLILSTLSNLIWVQVRGGRYEEAFATLNRFRNIPATWEMPDDEDLELKLFATTMSLELTIHAQMGAFDKALELAPMVERGLDRHGERLGPVRRAVLYYQLAYAYFGAGRPDKAIRWTDRLINDLRIDDGAEIVCFARILNMMALIDTGDLMRLPHVLRSTERFMGSRGRAYRFEPLFLELVRALLRAKDVRAAKEVCTHFEAGVRGLENDPYEQAVLDHLDPLAWAGARLTGRTYAELVRERVQRTARAA
jgi:tetratricopeptide (TPR) repeat protein